MDENEFYGTSVTITGNVEYVGEGDDPADNPVMIAYARALKGVYQPTIPDDLADPLKEKLAKINL
jgi:hypothetical protein